MNNDQFMSRAFDATVSIDGCTLGFAGDLLCERAVFTTLLGAHHARIAAQEAVLELSQVLSGRARS